ncbi:Cytochrome c553 [Nitrosomonas aestuarii]|uniref:Cytochrome c553 n=2 Tax=Nitrosomonas aestuarii TaxID=52441 RepID=A0A1I3XUD2_9PROT|nr:Cytochrome c553 [Nitrosomonas aestuarii]
MMKMIKTSMAMAAILAMAFSTSALAAGDIAKGQEIAAGVCAGCHNADGNSIIPINPKLAGQHAEYITKQLMDFKVEEGKTSKRNNPVMASMVAALTQEDMENLGAFYDAQDAASGAVSANKELLEIGKILYHGGNIENGVPACASCHGPTGSGVPPHYPMLAGQHAEYTLVQLNLFNTGDRSNDDGVMKKVLTRMSGEQKRAVSEYIQGMPLTK